jgi:biotin carboxylase
MKLMKKRLLMTTPWPKYAEVAKNEGFYLIVLWDKKTGDEETLNKIIKFIDELHVIDFKDEQKVESLIDLIHNHEPLEYMYHLGRDEHMELAYRIAQKYNLNLNSLKSIICMNDKFKMRNHLKDRNISSIKFKLTNLENIEEDVREFEFPYIVKPTSLSGSRGVLLCEKKQDLIIWKEYMSKYDYEGAYLIEEYLEGKEVSIETLSYQGEHLVIGITDKIKTAPPYFVELGHIFPSMLDENIRREISELVVEVLKSFNYQFGPVHTEVIITKKGPRIVELQPRLAGDRIPLLVEHSTGLSLEKSIFKMLQGTPPSIGKDKAVSRIHYFQWENGRVKDIKGIEKVQELNSVKVVEINLKPNMYIENIHDSSSRPGYVIVSGSSYEELNNEIQKIEDIITVSYY